MQSCNQYFNTAINVLNFVLNGLNLFFHAIHCLPKSRSDFTDITITLG